MFSRSLILLCRQISQWSQSFGFEDHSAPTVIQMTVVRAGSIDEVDGKSGIAHVLEHMMFKRTETMEEGEFSRIIGSLGGQENAFTSGKLLDIISKSIRII